MNFEKIVNRQQTNCFKWDANKQFFGTENVLPLWVADMDFPVADCIQNAIVERTKHHIYGYTFRPHSYYEAFQNWLANRYDWNVERKWLLDNPAIVPAINIAIQTFTEKEDNVLVQTPVYHPFFTLFEIILEH